MSTVTPPPLKRPERKVAAAPRLGDSPDARAIQVGIVATLFLHLLILLLLPEKLDMGTPKANAADDQEAQFEVDLQPENQNPARFVEVNPDVPDSPPDKTDNFGAQNQQVAQEEPTPNGDSDNPAIKGEKDVESTQIVDGQLNQPNLPPVPPQPEVQPQDQTQVAMAQRPAQDPLSGFEKFQGDDPNSIGSNIAQVSPNPQDVPQRVEGSEQQTPPNANSIYAQIDPQNPQPRPTVVQHNVRPAIFQDNPIGTSNIGPIAYNAKWSAYGEYLQKMIDAIQLRWEDFITAGRYYPPPGSRVNVSFVLNSAGEIASITSVDGTAGDQATNWCVSAISPQSDFSYGEWTPDMLTVLGDSQELTFSFLYR